jgi:NADPH-dependent 2,4-dienoyl-CoA reductase/sulfur reductase-like enzyme
MMQYVILGAGVAGMSAAEAIRSIDNPSSITLIGDDLHGFYSRPGLAYYLSGEIPKDLLFNYTPQAYKALNAKFVRGRVSKILPAEHRVEVEDGKQQYPYDRLLVATGSYALKPTVPGIDLEGVVKLDHMEDARRIISLSNKAKKAVVVGGGITALELAEGLAANRVKVRYLLRGDRYWGNVLDESESRIVENRLREDGISIQYQPGGGGIGKRTRFSVRLVSGEVIVRCSRRGGRNSQRMQKFPASRRKPSPMNRPIWSVYAAGDVARASTFFSGKYVLTRYESGREQGRVAGLNMAGVRTPYRKSPPLNVTRLAGLTTTIIGQVGGQRQRYCRDCTRDSETRRTSGCHRRRPGSRSGCG